MDYKCRDCGCLGEIVQFESGVVAPDGVTEILADLLCEHCDQDEPCPKEQEAGEE